MSDNNMYRYVENELMAKSLRYAKVIRSNEVIFVIATSEDKVIEVDIVKRKEEWILLNANVSSESFDTALQNYIRLTLDGMVQNIRVSHYENVVKLREMGA